MSRRIDIVLAFLASSVVACAGARGTAPDHCDYAPCSAPELDKDGLNRFVRDRLGIVKACYENSLKRNPTLQGWLAIRFTVHTDGTLQDVVAARDTLGSPEFADCVIRTFASWKTPFQPTERVSIEFPFHFRPRP